MGPTDDTPLLPGAWDSVEEERARIQRDRREEAQRTRGRELVHEFDAWLRELEHDPDEVVTATRTVRQLLRLKDELMDSPDPLEWSEQLLVELVTEVFPRELPDGLNEPQDAATDLLLFIDFLDSTKRWRNRPLGGHEATVLLIPIAYPAPEDWGPGFVLGSRE